VQLPLLLDQPALLPGHRLKRGVLTAALQLDEQGSLSANADIQDLVANGELPLQALRWQIDGRLDENGDFSFRAPLTTLGKSGDSTVNISVEHHVQGEQDRDVLLGIESPVFYLNDILNTLALIARQQEDSAASDGADATADTGAAERDDSSPDTRAFWNQTAYNTKLELRVDRLFYTDYLEFTGIRGSALSMPDRLSIEGFEAHFHDSPITLDGAFTFTPGSEPYDVQLDSRVDQFDLARFFRELVPGARPRAEGLFDVRINAFGKSPNLAQYRNNLYFDGRLQSRQGLFRLLDPNSPLVTGSTGFAGGVGELLSYVPTGLFGVGAVSRLVDYIKEVNYDKIVVELARDASRDVQIRQYVVQNEELLMTASGGIRYQPGVDILQSPLSLDARLSLREKGAAIFYDLDLLESEYNEWGYWLGPEIRFRGTPANPESNLDDIIADAGRGAVLGGITRPVSGLIGNITHRWLDEKPPRREYETED
jgi:hypothetical protein